MYPKFLICLIQLLMHSKRSLIIYYQYIQRVVCYLYFFELIILHILILTFQMKPWRIFRFRSPFKLLCWDVGWVRSYPHRAQSLAILHLGDFPDGRRTCRLDGPQTLPLGSSVSIPQLQNLSSSRLQIRGNFFSRSVANCICKLYWHYN